MPLVSSTPTASPSPRLSSLAKMEDRKRPAATEDVAPPAKRLATVNGSKASAEPDTDLKEDTFIEKYQKGAIYRQMQEYKRRAQTLEEQLEDLRKKSTHHDEHLRVLDAWWRQLSEEVELLAGSVPEPSLPTNPPYLSALRFENNIDFQVHLEDHGKSIRSRLENLFKRLESRDLTSTPTAELEAKLSRLLAAQKEYLVKLDRMDADKNQLSEQLNMATLRYIRAERKLDRTKSTQVHRLEQQALASATRSAQPASENGKEDIEMNGSISELQQKLDETVAAETKHQEQIELLSNEIKALQEENSRLISRRESLTDEDFIRTDVFRAFKAQNEELIKRLNHLEALTKQLRDEAEKLQAERTAFRTQLEEEAQAVTQELEEEVRQRDQDLARVRAARDEYLMDRDMRKASQEQERTATEHMKELLSASDERMAALESQLQRYKPSEDTTMASPSEVDDLSPDELRERYRKLERDFQAINQELPSIEQAYKKFKALAQKKVMDLHALEEQVAMARAEKAKADQKYFAARKDTDTRMAENRALRIQNAKSTEVISQFKETDAANRLALVNLEKQLVDLRQANSAFEADRRKAEAASVDAARRTEYYKAQVSELSNLVKARDAAAALIRERNMAQDAELERLRVRLDHTTKDRDGWKQKALSNSSEEEEMFRRSLLCTVCEKNFKNTVLKTCGHIFCNECIEARINNRMRKCPNCSKSFDKMDSMAVHGLG